MENWELSERHFAERHDSDLLMVRQWLLDFFSGVYNPVIYRIPGSKLEIGRGQILSYPPIPVQVTMRSYQVATKLT
jgi:hypothetical protein